MLKYKDLKTKMQYKVPQNVQREDTIIGPLTLKQMGILGAGGAIAYAIYVTLAKTYYMEVWLPPVAVITVITLAFTFLKIHDLTFFKFITCLVEFHLLPTKRIWIQGADSVFISSLEEKKEEKVQAIKQEKNRKSLKEITEVLDSYGESGISKQEKKENLEKIINQNYK